MLLFLLPDSSPPPSQLPLAFPELTLLFPGWFGNFMGLNLLTDGRSARARGAKEAFCRDREQGESPV